MSSYHTAQKSLMLDFLTENPERSFTAEELSEAMIERFGAESAPGKSTVYRLIRKMADDGVVKRTARGDGRGMVYQASAGERCAMHLHLKCTECGRLLHMSDERSGNILGQIFSENKFSVDERQTVLVGRCADCAEKEEV